jgi:hypothetical protein
MATRRFPSKHGDIRPERHSHQLSWWKTLLVSISFFCGILQTFS